jgi:uncharacterized membrane protein
MMSENDNKIEEDKKKVLRNYILLCVSLVLPIIIIFVLYLHRITKDGVKNTWLESHSVWQIKTAMTYIAVMLFVIVGMILGYGADHTSIKDIILLISAFLVVGAINIWVLYRVFVGLMRFGDDAEISKASK